LGATRTWCPFVLMLAEPPSHLIDGAPGEGVEVFSDRALPDRVDSIGELVVREVSPADQ